ncbi:MAG TPA: efflux RND transporter permease subunit, partial [bacterium]|nr:efflux RND transporter permease subunit [bacterium]
LTTILGLIPLAIGIGEGTEMQTPLARTVCGGLSSSTLITLILIPVMYVLFNRKYLKKNRAQSDTNL